MPAGAAGCARPWIPRAARPDQDPRRDRAVGPLERLRARAAPATRPDLLAAGVAHGAGAPPTPSPRPSRRAGLARRARRHRERHRRGAACTLKWFVRRIAWPLLNPGVALHWTPAHDAICEHLEAFEPGEQFGSTPLVINCPPRIGKSTIITIAWPAWLWLQRPELRLFTVSHSREAAIRLNVDRRQLIESKEYQALKPGWTIDESQLKPDCDFEIVKGRNVKVTYYNTRRGFMRAVSTKSKLTGDHCDIAVIDDPLDADPKSLHEAHLAEWWDWFDSKFVSRFRGDPRVVLVMQRLAAGDPAERLLRDWRADHLNLPLAHMESYDCPCRPKGTHRCTTRLGFEDWREVEGQLLDEQCVDGELVGGGDLISREFIAQLQRTNMRRYLTQYQQLVTALAGNMLLEHWWQRWRDPPSDGRWVILIDASGGGQSKKASYLVIQVQCLAADGRVYIVDQFRMQATRLQTRHAVDLMLQRWGRVVHEVFVEVKQLGIEVFDSWITHYMRPGSGFRGEFIGVTPETSFIKAGLPSGSTKEQRVEAWQMDCQTGRLVIPTLGANRPFSALGPEPRLSELDAWAHIREVAPAIAALRRGDVEEALRELSRIDIPLNEDDQEEAVQRRRLRRELLDAYRAVRTVAISSWSVTAWPVEFVDEAKAFPHGTNDQMDCVSMGVLLAFRGMVGRSIEAESLPDDEPPEMPPRMWDMRSPRWNP